MTSSLKLKFLRTCPALHEKAALWFGGKWNISPDLYRKSIGSAGTDGRAVPQWYVLVDEDDNIVAGAGVIENDFHERRDLSPNVSRCLSRKHTAAEASQDIFSTVYGGIWGNLALNASIW